jgi:hypothetical protein
MSLSRTIISEQNVARPEYSRFSISARDLAPPRKLEDELTPRRRVEVYLETWRNLPKLNTLYSGNFRGGRHLYPLIQSKFDVPKM